MQTDELVRTLQTVEDITFDQLDLSDVRARGRRTRRRRRVPAAAAAVVAAMTVPAVVLMPNATESRPPAAGSGTATQAPEVSTPGRPEQPTATSPASDGVGDPWPAQLRGQPLCCGSRLDSGIERTGMESPDGRTALLFAVATSADHGTPAYRNVDVGYRDAESELVDVAPVFTVGQNRKPWLTFNGFSAGRAEDGWVTYGYLSDPRVTRVLVTSTDGSQVEATLGAPDRVLAGARLFWAQGTGLRIERIDLLDRTAGVVDSCRFWDCPQ